MRQHICSVTEREPPEAGYLLTQALQLIGVGDDERGSMPRVLDRLDHFLVERRKKRLPASTPHAHSLALQLGVLMGQQLKRAGWLWVAFDWVKDSPLARYEPKPDPEGHVSVPRWGLVTKDRALLVLPVHDLVAVQLLRRPPIAFAKTIPAVLRAQSIAETYELMRLVDDGVELVDAAR
jgi:hypothetical protein